MPFQFYLAVQGEGEEACGVLEQGEGIAFLTALGPGSFKRSRKRKRRKRKTRKKIFFSAFKITWGGYEESMPFIAFVLILVFSSPLFVPLLHGEDSASSQEKSADSSPAKKPTELKYIVKKGDSLWKISRKYKVTVDALMAINELKDDRLKPGQELIIPPKGYRPPPREPLASPSQEEKKEPAKAEPSSPQNPQ